MANSFEAVDAARKRCELLLRILKLTRDRALADPTGSYTVALGIISVGDKKDDAARKVAKAFEELDGLLSHLTLIDMTAALEQALTRRIATAVGEARRAVKDEYQLEVFSRVREALVHEVDDFQGLAGIETLLSAQMSDELKLKLRTIRSERNKFAHGTDVTVPPLIDTSAVYDTLKTITDLTF
jgi:hypothetical protein